ncbi:hypothetical protein ACJX0J_022607, partial [Zea mays]
DANFLCINSTRYSTAKKFVALASNKKHAKVVKNILTNQDYTIISNIMRTHGSEILIFKEIWLTDAQQSPASFHIKLKSCGNNSIPRIIVANILLSGVKYETVIATQTNLEIILNEGKYVLSLYTLSKFMYLTTSILYIHTTNELKHVLGWYNKPNIMKGSLTNIFKTESYLLIGMNMAKMNINSTHFFTGNILWKNMSVPHVFVDDNSVNRMAIPRKVGIP